MKKYFKNLFNIIRTPSVQFLPGNIAFFLVLSIFPILTLIGVIASSVGVDSEALISVIDSSLPSNISVILDAYITGKGFDTNIGIFMFIGFILASNGAHTIILASNNLYGFPNSFYLKRRIKSVFIIILLLVMLIFMIGFIAFGNYIINYIVTEFEDPAMSDIVYKVFRIIKWPFSILILFLNVKLIYIIAPDWKVPSGHTTKGAIFTTVCWIVVIELYSYWVTHLVNYDLFYGSLSNIVILMIMTYFVAYILVIVIAINVKSNENKKYD